jgi:hypothetical protein
MTGGILVAAPRSRLLRRVVDLVQHSYCRTWLPIWGDMIFGIIATFNTLLELSAWPFISRLPPKLTIALHRFLIFAETTNAGWLAYTICAQPSAYTIRVPAKARAGAMEAGI